MSHSTLETQTFFNLVLSKKATFFWIVLVTAVFSTAVSYLIPPKYKTTAVVYPIHLIPYSKESETEQLLQYLNSTAVRNAVINKMHLIQYYGIDTTKSTYKTLLYNTYGRNISIFPTLYQSIEIKVRDRKPEMTKAIAECIIQTTDSIILCLKKSALIEEYRNYQKEIKAIEHRVDSLISRIIAIQNKYNIFDANNQAKYLSRKLSNSKPDAEQLKTIEALKNEKEHIKILERMVKGEILSLNKLKKQRDKIELDLQGKLSFCQVVSPPYVPDKKYFPLRWLVVTLSELSVITIFTIYLIFTHQTRKINHAL